MPKSSALAYSLARDLQWEHLLAAEADDGKSWYVLGWDEGFWWVARRGLRGEPLQFPDGNYTKMVCAGVLGESDLEDDGDGLIIVTVAVGGKDNEEVYRDLFSDDGGMSWRPFVG